MVTSYRPTVTARLLVRFSCAASLEVVDIKACAILLIDGLETKESQNESLAELDRSSVSLRKKLT